MCSLYYLDSKQQGSQAECIQDTQAYLQLCCLLNGINSSSHNAAQCRVCQWNRWLFALLIEHPVFLFSSLGMWARSFELGKFMHKVEKLGKVDEYEKCNTYLQTFINLVKLLFCLFGKHSDLILGLKTFRFQSFLKNISINIIQNFQIGNFFLSTGNKRYFFALGIEPNFRPK